MFYSINLEYVKFHRSLKKLAVFYLLQQYSGIHIMYLKQYYTLHKNIKIYLSEILLLFIQYNSKQMYTKIKLKKTLIYVQTKQSLYLVHGILRM